MRGIFLGESPDTLRRVWGPAQRARLAAQVEFPPADLSAKDLSRRLGETEVIFSTWGMPLLDERQLACLPRLRAVFYAAGSVKGFADPLLAHGVTVVSAWAANAVPVAEFTLAQILFGLKAGWRHARAFAANPSPASWRQTGITGAYGATVGIISLGMIGRRVCELLRPFSLTVLACDPFAGDDDFRAAGARRASLEEIFSTCDVVSLHAPSLPETRGLVTRELIASMKTNATFLNTARGALVDEAGIVAALRDRPDLTAVLDVTDPEPPAADSPLYTMPNIVLTPHIAGSAGNEVLRMADLMIEEFLSWHAGKPLRYAVTPDLLTRIG